MKRELALQFCLPAGSPHLKLYRIEGQGISVRRFEFLQPIAVLAAARYCGAATTYSLLSPKISCVLSSDWSDLFVQPGTSLEDREKLGNR